MARNDIVELEWYCHQRVLLAIGKKSFTIAEAMVTILLIISIFFTKNTEPNNRAFGMLGLLAVYNYQ
jgi:hypothetical protein